MTKEKYNSDFEMDSETDESDDNSIDHADFYQPRNRESYDNTEVKLTLMQKARKRPGHSEIQITQFKKRQATLVFLFTFEQCQESPPTYESAGRLNSKY
ncbi:unnamed protein product [Schistosoma margrebowiei]|uniref:Uncharacterized protein n=1 Tax=Schistosoma margrebowiei TaxID=48269 RepID=A0A183LLN8_9TREM|nr:unnamed protein product [Schistosoma margrebowiei]